MKKAEALLRPNEESPYPGLERVDRKHSVGAYLQDLWSRRDFMVVVPRANLRAKNMDTVLGNLWHILNPVLMIGVYFLIFGVILDTSRGVDNFLAFLSIGIFVFSFTSRSAQQGASSIVNNEGLIRSIQFPRAVLPISVVIEQTFAFLPSLLVLFGVALATGEVPVLSWLWFAPLLAVQVAFNMGVAFYFARFTTHFRDTINFLPFLFRLWFYMSGVLFPVKQFVQDDLARLAFDLNPMYAMVTIAREAVFGRGLPEFLTLVVVAWAIVVLVSGFFYFWSAEEHYGRG